MPKIILYRIILFRIILVARDFTDSGGKNFGGKVANGRSLKRPLADHNLLAPRGLRSLALLGAADEIESEASLAEATNALVLPLHSLACRHPSRMPTLMSVGKECRLS